MSKHLHFDQHYFNFLAALHQHLNYLGFHQRYFFLHHLGIIELDFSHYVIRILQKFLETTGLWHADDPGR